MESIWIALLREHLQEVTGVSVLLRLCLAALIGGFVGWERERRGRAAGLRTHILVCLGACLSALIGVYSVDILDMGGDPNRIAAQVISGIGFLGIGTIMVGRASQVTGLTTAAGLWTTAAVGIALGVGFYWAAILTTVLIFVAIRLLAALEHAVRKRHLHDRIYVELNTAADVAVLQMETSQWDFYIEVMPPRSGGTNHVGVELNFPGQAPGELVSYLHTAPYILFVLQE